jgi:hypothetical protein
MGKKASLVDLFSKERDRAETLQLAAKHLPTLESSQDVAQEISNPAVISPAAVALAAVPVALAAVPVAPAAVPVADALAAQPPRSHAPTSLQTFRPKQQRCPVVPQASNVDIMKWTTMAVVVLVIGYVFYRLYKLVTNRRRRRHEEAEAKKKQDGAALHITESKHAYAQRIPTFVPQQPPSTPVAAAPPAAPSSPVVAAPPAAPPAVPSSPAAAAPPAVPSSPAAAAPPAAPSSPAAAAPPAAPSSPAVPTTTKKADAGPRKLNGGAEQPKANGSRARVQTEMVIEEIEDDSDRATKPERRTEGAVPTAGARSSVDDFLDGVQRRGAGYPGP